MPDLVLPNRFGATVPAVLPLRRGAGIWVAAWSAWAARLGALGFAARSSLEGQVLTGERKVDNTFQVDYHRQWPIHEWPQLSQTSTTPVFSSRMTGNGCAVATDCRTSSSDRQGSRNAMLDLLVRTASTCLPRRAVRTPFQSPSPWHQTTSGGERLTF